MSKKLDLKGLMKENNDPEYIVSCLNILTPLEKSIILVLHSKQSALNIKQIQNEIILNLLYVLQRWRQGWSGLGDEMDDILREKVKLVPYYDLTPDDAGRLNDVMVDAEMKSTKKKFSLDSSQSAIIGYKKRMTKRGISYPSFEKIEVDVRELQRMDLLIKRETSDRKSKGLWAVNPTIDFYLKKTKFNLYNTRINPNKNRPDLAH